MKAVVDTNVVAYLLLGEERFQGEARRFWVGVEDAIAPAHWEAELANVLWLAGRARALSAMEALARLRLAAGLQIRAVAVRSLWESAMLRSLRSGLAVYDTLFVELAAREDLPLATFDAAVLRAFPTIARRPGRIVK